MICMEDKRLFSSRFMRGLQPMSHWVLTICTRWWQTHKYIQSTSSKYTADITIIIMHRLLIQTSRVNHVTTCLITLYKTLYILNTYITTHYIIQILMTEMLMKTIRPIAVILALVDQAMSLLSIITYSRLLQAQTHWRCSAFWDWKRFRADL